MKNMDILIIGAGIMGSGIAQVIAQKGMFVNILDKSNNSLVNSQNQIRKSLSRLVKKNIIGADDMNTIINKRILWNDSIDKIFQNKHIDLIIEAVPENEDIKLSIIKKINDIANNEHLIYASNTSSISITKMASYFYKPKNFIGMHFMNPVPVMKLVEIIPGIQTDLNTINVINDFAEKIGKITTKIIVYTLLIIRL